MYLDADRDDVGEAGERFRRVQPVHGRIHHPGEQVDVVELRGRPPDKGLLGPLPGPAETTQPHPKSHHEQVAVLISESFSEHVYLSSGFRPVSSSSITTPKLYTSLLVVYVPDMANSGALYPNEPTTSAETWCPASQCYLLQTKKQLEKK